MTSTAPDTTADATAKAGSDYAARTADQSIAVGQDRGTFTVIVNGDTLQEDNERFLVRLSAAAGAILGDSQGVGTIIDDQGHIKMPSTATVAEKWPVAAARTGILLHRMGLRRQLEP